MIEFLTDYLRLMVGGNLNAFEIENLMDNEIETHHHEGEVPIHSIAKLGDAMPAFGIVAAVMGVVHTMESVGTAAGRAGHADRARARRDLPRDPARLRLRRPAREPCSSRSSTSRPRCSRCVKVTLLASLNGYAPALAVEFGRKVLYSTERPSFIELEQHVKKK